MKTHAKHSVRYVFTSTSKVWQSSTGSVKFLPSLTLNQTPNWNVRQFHTMSVNIAHVYNDTDTFIVQKHTTKQH